MTTIIQLAASGLPIYFLNGTVLSFNSSIGFGSQQESTLNVDLVEDCALGQNINVEVGSPQYFTAGSFSFGGLVTSWNESQSTNGKIHNVRLTDPRQILQNVVVIVDDFSFTPLLRGLNFFNVYAYFENSCSTFGDSNSNDQGMPYSRIIQGLSLMNPTIYSTTQYPFIIDFSTFPTGLPEYYRVPGPGITLLQLLQDVCDVVGYDFYVYMIRGENNSNIIKIGLVDLKNEPPSFETVISKFDGEAIDISFGQESRNDVTRSMILGEQVHYLSYVNEIIPYFGLDKQNNIMSPVVPIGYDNNGFTIAKTVNSLAASLLTPCFSIDTQYTIHELDLRCAMASFQSWILRAMASNTPGSFNAAIRAAYSDCVNNNPEDVKRMISDPSQYNILQISAHKNVQDLFHNPTSYRANSYDPTLLEDLETIHGWLADLGNTYYGKQYLAALSESICFSRTSFISPDINTEGQTIFSSTPTSAGGWNESDTILGLTSPELDVFKTDDGRIKCFARFNSNSLNCGNLNVENLGDDAIAIGNNTWIAADIEEKIYLHRADPNTPYRGYVALKFNSQCVGTICDSSAPKTIQFGVAAPLENLKTNQSRDFAYGDAGWGIGYSMTLIPGRSIPDVTDNVATAPMAGIDHQSMDDLGFSPIAVSPIEVMIPMRNNVLSYGPWFSSNFWTSAGGADVSVNTDLAPWVFGSLSATNSAGNSIVQFAARGLTKAENGSVTVPGIPSSAHGLPILGSRVSSTGPNLTSVNFSLGTKGATTNYEFKTYTPKFGKLTKLFIDRYKNTYKERQNQLRLLRSQQADQNRLYRKLANSGNRRSKRTKFNSKQSDGIARVFVGTMDPWYTDPAGQKTSIGITTLHNVSSEAAFGYSSKAFMSLDGIFSPVSKNGDGGFPSYYPPEDENVKGLQSSYPPTLGDDNQIFINIKTCDPLMGDLNGGAGHSVDIVGRNENVPEQGLINSFYSASDKSKYSQDYRFISLRGPLVLHSWGYDLDGKPVPGNGDTFIGNVLQNPASWPVAPVDLRLDKKRGVWVSPPPHKIVSAQLTETLNPYSSAIATIINEKPEKNDKPILVKDKIGQGFLKKTKIYAYYDSFEDAYITLEASQYPTVITGTAKEEFNPSTEKITISVLYTSHIHEKVAFELGTEIEALNLLGFGACKGDYVTAHLSLETTAESNEDKDLYQYIVQAAGGVSTYDCCS